jgi:hypothetical protein
MEGGDGKDPNTSVCSALCAVCAPRDWSRGAYQFIATQNHPLVRNASSNASLAQPIEPIVRSDPSWQAARVPL